MEYIQAVFFLNIGMRMFPTTSPGSAYLDPDMFELSHVPTSLILNFPSCQTHLTPQKIPVENLRERHFLRIKKANAQNISKGWGGVH